MAGRIIQAARRTGAGVPLTVSYAYATGQTFKKGAAVVLSSGEVVTCVDDATTILGFAAEPAGSKPGYDAANSPTVVTGRVQEADIFVAGPTQWFSGSFRSDDTTYVLPTTAIIGNIYGIAFDADGTCYVNQANTTDDAVQIVDIEVGPTAAESFVYFVVIAAARQTP